MESKVFDYIKQEQERQNRTIELIASENFVSQNVLKAMGSCLTNKYAEGYPVNRHSGNCGRYYGGCENVNNVEEYCCNMWRKAFKTDYHINVQPHSGSQANMAAYLSILKPGDKILAMNLNNGGHLSHGSPVNFSGKLFDVYFYDVNSDGFIDYDDIARKAYELRPALILAGASAYSRIIDFQIFRDIANAVKAYFMVDMAHIAGLVISGDHPSPFTANADIITTTTHKTLRGPRGGLIFCKPEFAKKVDTAVFPCTQGGPLEHIIAAKAVAAEEACDPSFIEYGHQIVKNCKAMCNEFIKLGYDIVTGGTDNHLFLLDLTKFNISGKQVQDELDKFDITLNKNCIPNEMRSPQQASGVRIGTAAMTTKGYKEQDFIDVARKIDDIIKSISSS